MRILKNIARELAGRSKGTEATGLPTVAPAHPFFKNALSFAKGPLPFMLREWEGLGDIYDVNFPQIPFFIVSHPDYVKHVLVDNNRNYKKAFSLNFLKYTMGNGLVTNEGKSWLKQRRTAQPAFHRERLAALVATMVDDTDTLTQLWSKKANTGTPASVVADMMHTTSAIASHTLLATEVGASSSEIVDLISVVNHETTQKLVNPLRSPMWVPTPRNRALKRAIARLDEIIYDILDERRQTATHRNDLLTMLMEAQDEESGDFMSDVQLRDEVVTLILAGTETSANALSWTISLLLQHPHIINRLREEVDPILSQGELSFEKLSQLKYTSQVLNEAMRIYPPAWITGREALADDKIAGYPVPRGSQVYVCPYLVHRHPGFWNRPNAFDPDRFSKEKTKGRHKFAYFPFGGGPRYCIGNNFAMMEMQIILATLINQFNIKPLSKLPPAVEPLLTLRPKNEILIQVSQR